MGTGVRAYGRSAVALATLVFSAFGATAMNLTRSARHDNPLRYFGVASAQSRDSATADVVTCPVIAATDAASACGDAAPVAGAAMRGSCAEPHQRAGNRAAATPHDVAHRSAKPDTGVADGAAEWRRFLGERGFIGELDWMPR
jgi:hypothetical protein